MVLAAHLRPEVATRASTHTHTPSLLAHCHVDTPTGESGLGKTTFINNLVSSFKVVSAHKVQDGSATSLHQFTADPASLRTVLEPLDIPESSRRLLVTIQVRVRRLCAPLPVARTPTRCRRPRQRPGRSARHMPRARVHLALRARATHTPAAATPWRAQDMPGWGDDVNLARYLRTVTAFVLRGREQDYALLSGARHPDAAAMCGQLQHSITACLYFLPPHRVKKVDLILMAAISQLVRSAGLCGCGCACGATHTIARGHAHAGTPLHVSPAPPMVWACLCRWWFGAAQCGAQQAALGATRLPTPPLRHTTTTAAAPQVTIIPVIAKADTMTEGELAAYRHEVNAMLAAPSKVVGARHLPALDVSLFGFGEGALAALGGDKGRLPLAVVCSRDSEALGAQAGARQQPVRAYRWGSCYPLNAAHSDLVLLKRLLLGDQVDSMYAMLDDSYRCAHCVCVCLCDMWGCARAVATARH
jgi:septin family protein